MKLRWIKVNSLYDTFNHTIELKEEGLTIIHSPNGLGKSTMMKMIFLAFTGCWDELNHIPFERLEFGFEEGRRLIFLKKETLEVTLLDAGEIIQVDKTEVKSITNVVYLGPQRLFKEEEGGYFSSTLKIYAEDVSERIKKQQAFALERWTECEKIPEEIRKDPKSHLAELKAKMAMIQNAGILPSVLEEILRDLVENDAMVWDEKKLLTLHKLICVADVLYPLAEEIVTLQDIVNPMLFRKKLIINAEEGLSVFFDDGKNIPLERLSSGERHLLLMLYTMVFVASPGSLVIIDEPEISMHITWQQRLASLFMEICEARDIQVLMATHSPQVVHDKWDLTVELVI